MKAAFTRAYNKNSAAVPYIMGGTSKKKSSQNLESGDLLEEEEGEVNSDENDDNVDTDKMIKVVLQIIFSIIEITYRRDG